MNVDLSGRTALITGGARGIGFAIAQAFAREGCATIHLAARGGDDFSRKVDDLRSESGATFVTHAVDVGARGGAEQLAAACPNVDILVNNAGAIPGGSLFDVGEDAWRKAWDVKVFGYVNLTRAVYQSMRTRRTGVICNVVGAAGVSPNANYIAAGSANAALIYLTEALGGVSLADGVRVLGVNPGPVLTERLIQSAKRRATEQFGDPEQYAKTFAGLPRGRPAHPDEVASLVTYLVSDQASYLSGMLVRIDGGLHARPPHH